jgi:DNA repair exonuclease SbcCD ATPase subunit
MITFKSIKWKNFLSYGEIETKVELTGNRATLVIGDNGAGKSTMIDVLCYALYGKAFRNIATTQLVNSVNGNHMEAEVEFNAGKHTYNVRRGLKPRYFEVYKDGKLLNQEANARDYQEILEKQILKINHKSFKQVVVLGSSSFIPFMQLNSKDRKEVIEDLLDIGIFSIMSSLLKDKSADNKDSIRKIDVDWNAIVSKIDMLHEHIEQLESLRTEEIAKKKDEIEILVVEQREVESEIAELNKVVDALKEQIIDYDDVKAKLSHARTVHAKMIDKASRLKKQVEFYQKNDTCPTCMQPMDEDHKHENIEQKGGKVKEIVVNATKLDTIMDEFNDKIEVFVTVQHAITERQHEIIDKQSIFNSKNMLVKKLQEQVNDVSNSTEDTNKHKKTVEVMNDQKENMFRQKAELVREKNIIEIATRLLKDSGIKARIIKQYVPVINKLINKYLASMDFFVQFELDEQFNETIRSRYRDDFSYASFSEGEKMRIDLALLFTWRAIAKLKNSASTNLLIMDEVFDSSLDTAGTDEFMKIVMDIVSDTNVFIISHKTDQLVDKFTNVIRFEKHKNFSRMIE